jgi:hypothetical protein
MTVDVYPSLEHNCHRTPPVFAVLLMFAYTSAVPRVPGRTFTVILAHGSSEFHLDTPLTSNHPFDL